MQEKKGGAEDFNLALFSDKEGILVYVWDGKKLGHQVVAEIPRGHLHRLPGFPQFVDCLEANQTRREIGSKKEMDWRSGWIPWPNQGGGSPW